MYSKLRMYRMLPGDPQASAFLDRKFVMKQVPQNTPMLTGLFIPVVDLVSLLDDHLAPVAFQRGPHRRGGWPLPRRSLPARLTLQRREDWGRTCTPCTSTSLSDKTAPCIIHGNQASRR